MIAMVLISTLSLLTSCVHEFPEPENPRTIVLKIHHDLEWDLLHYLSPVSKSRVGVNKVQTRYVYRIYRVGEFSHFKEVIHYNDDILRTDFIDTLQLVPGKYDVRVWSDYCDMDGTPLYFDATDFKGIIYAGEYGGNDTYKDAFEATINLECPSPTQLDVKEVYEITMKRPLTSHAFIATDLLEFIRAEAQRRGLKLESLPKGSFHVEDYIPDFSGYTVKFTYPAYLPSVYSHFSGKPIDSSVGITFTAPITQLNEKEAMLGFDYFFINGTESQITVMLSIYDAKGDYVAGTNSFNIPVKRSRCTVVRGEFLTSKSTDGVGIDPTFNGDINIKI